MMPLFTWESELTADFREGVEMEDQLSIDMGRPSLFLHFSLVYT